MQKSQIRLSSVLTFIVTPYTRGLKHAASGPHVARQMHLCGPRTPQKNYKIIIFDQIKLILRAFLVYCGPQSILSLECGPPNNLSLRPLPYTVCFTDLVKLNLPLVVQF
jgi:hypothetical protein